MKKILLTVLLLGAASLGFYIGSLGLVEVKNRPKHRVKNQAQSKQKSKLSMSSQSVFIPYWQMDYRADLSTYDELIYFGVTADLQGIDKSEPGFKNLERFDKIQTAAKKLLTLRLLNDEISKSLLSDKKLQSKIIDEVLELLEDYEFEGLVLDLEVTELFISDITDQINDFAQLFYTRLKQNYRKFYLTIFGDNFYRKRPYDLRSLGQNSDGILIMAYDFHKSRGEPGPNFPLESGAKYQYDFKKMIEDFTELVPKDKIIVVFGYFGYDWLVDEKKRPIRQAEALTYNIIKSKFLTECGFKDCLIKRDKLSSETEINYLISSQIPDEQNIYRIDYHVVWFEDKKSIDAKSKYLLDQGLDKVSYWAYGYF